MPLYNHNSYSNAVYNFTPPTRALIGESFPVLHIASNNAIMPTAGRLEFIRIRVPVSSSVTNITGFISTAGATLTAGQCFASLFTGAGVLVGTTADQSGAWVSGGTKTMALASGPFSITAGDYYVGMWYNGTTAPTWRVGTNSNTTLTNLGVAAPNLLAGTADTGLTTTPPSPMGAQTGGATLWWMALS